MIGLKDIAEALNSKLNANIEGSAKPSDISFLVAYDGFRLTSVADRDLKRNVVFVYVSDFYRGLSPIQGIMKLGITCTVNFYAPVALKDEIAEIIDWISSEWSGGTVSIGDSSSTMVAVGSPEYGDLISIDAESYKLFDAWTSDFYGVPSEVMTPYLPISLELTLGATYNDTTTFWNGNAFSVSATGHFSDGTTESADFVFVNSATAMVSTFASQQLIGETTSYSYPNISADNISFQAYVENNAFFQKVWKDYVSTKLSTDYFDLSFGFPSWEGDLASSTWYLQQCVFSMNKGETVTAQFVFVRKREDD